MGVLIDSQLPYLIGMGTDILSTGVHMYHLKEGKTMIGNEESNKETDIVLTGPNILNEHCIIEHRDGTVTLFPLAGAHYTVQGVEVQTPTKLTQGRQELERLVAQIRQLEDALQEKEEEMWVMHDQHKQDTEDQKQHLAHLIKENQCAREQAEEEIKQARENLKREKEAYYKQIQAEMERLRKLEQKEHREQAVQTEAHQCTTSTSFDMEVETFSDSVDAAVVPSASANVRKKSVSDRMKELKQEELKRKYDFLQKEEQLKMKIPKMGEEYKKKISNQNEKLQERHKQSAMLEVYIEEKQDLINVGSHAPRPLHSARGEMFLTDPNLIEPKFSCTHPNKTLHETSPADILPLSSIGNDLASLPTQTAQDKSVNENNVEPSMPMTFFPPVTNINITGEQQEDHTSSGSFKQDKNIYNKFKEGDSNQKGFAKQTQIGERLNAAECSSNLESLPCLLEDQAMEVPDISATVVPNGNEFPSVDTWSEQKEHNASKRHGVNQARNRDMDVSLDELRTLVVDDIEGFSDDNLGRNQKSLCDEYLSDSRVQSRPDVPSFEKLQPMDRHRSLLDSGFFYHYDSPSQDTDTDSPEHRASMQVAVQEMDMKEEAEASDFKGKENNKGSSEVNLHVSDQRASGKDLNGEESSTVRSNAATAELYESTSTAELSGSASTAELYGSASTAELSGSASTKEPYGSTSIAELSGSASTAELSGSTSTAEISDVSGKEVSETGSSESNADIGDFDDTYEMKLNNRFTQGDTEQISEESVVYSSAKLSGSTSAAELSGLTSTAELSGSISTAELSGSTSSAKLSGSTSTAELSGSASTAEIYAVSGKDVSKTRSSESNADIGDFDDTYEMKLNNRFTQGDTEQISEESVVYSSANPSIHGAKNKEDASEDLFSQAAYNDRDKLQDTYQQNTIIESSDHPKSTISQYALSQRHPNADDHDLHSSFISETSCPDVLIENNYSEREITMDSSSHTAAEAFEYNANTTIGLPIDRTENVDIYEGENNCTITNTNIIQVKEQMRTNDQSMLEAMSSDNLGDISSEESLHGIPSSEQKESLMNTLDQNHVSQQLYSFEGTMPTSDSSEEIPEDLQVNKSDMDYVPMLEPESSEPLKRLQSPLMPPETRSLGVGNGQDLLNIKVAGDMREDGHSQYSNDSLLDPHKELQVLQESLIRKIDKETQTTEDLNVSSNGVRDMTSAADFVSLLYPPQSVIVELIEANLNYTMGQTETLMQSILAQLTDT